MINPYRDFAWMFLSMLPQTVLMRRNGEERITRVLAETTDSVLITYLDVVMFQPFQMEVPYMMTVWIKKSDPRIVSDVATDVSNIIPFTPRRRVLG